MKISYLSSSIIPSRSANSIHVMKMCQALADSGCDVSLFAPDVRDGIELGVADVYDYYGVKPVFSIRKVAWQKWIGRDYLSGLLAALSVARGDYNLVLARCLPSAFFSSLFNVPVIFEYHQPISDSGRLSWVKDILFRKLIRRESFVCFVAITEALKAYYLECYPELKGRIHIAPDGSDPFPLVPEPLSLRGRGERLQIGYVGQLYSGKGMEIISQLCRAVPSMDFHVVGGLQADIEKWQRVVQETNITFHGFVPHSQAPSYIAAFDVLLLPNQNRITWHKAGGDIGQWTSPLKMFEYMSAGKAIISSDIPVLREVLEDEVNALLCPPDDLEAWVKALHRLEDSALRARLGKRALAEFLEKYTWQRRAQTIMAHFGYTSASGEGK